MTVRNLESLFQPKSIAVIGASTKRHSVGATVLDNLLHGGYAGPIFPVNPNHNSTNGVTTWPSVSSLPEAPELAVICTPAASVPRLIAELGTRGTKAAVVLSAGLNSRAEGHGPTLKSEMLAAARPHVLRVLGPNCIGLLVPGLGLNASFAHTNALAGHIAFVSQSGGLVTGVLDWAKSRGIGFSKFVSLGEGADIDFGDLIDYLGSDPETHAILLYMESISAARKFMTAARAAARVKPVLIVKAGRVPEGARAAATHTSAMVGRDDIYDAAIRRCGMLRVYTTEDLFDAVETLAVRRPLHGERLTIVTNGGGPGVMATDALILGGGRLATLSEATMQKLNQALPATWSHGNPVDIVGDALTERHVQALTTVLTDTESDAVLYIQVPTAIVPSAEIAYELAPIAACATRNVLVCCLGGEAVAQAKTIFRKAGIPVYDTPESAVRAFLQMVDYKRSQNLLREVPHSVTSEFPSGRDIALAIIRTALESGRTLLSELEAKGVLKAYGIPIVETKLATSAAEAVRLAEVIGFPVAVKLLSPDISHKSDVGGVALDLGNAGAVLTAIEVMAKTMRELKPDARVQGYTVQSMVRRTHAQELIVGVSMDATFGPVLIFGKGGVEVEVTDDSAIGLLPLNMTLARDVVSRTRISRLLAGYRNRPPADLNAVGQTLVQVSRIFTEIAEIAELDINPLLANENGVVALDARIVIARAVAPAVDRFAIRPYPRELEESVSWQGQPLLLRPIRPEDYPEHVDFLDALTPEDMRMRMFISVRKLQPSEVARFTQIDYDREMAFIATRQRNGEHRETLGVVRAVADPDNIAAEFAIVVRSDLKGRGLGRLLLAKLITYLRSRGTEKIVGETLPHNSALLELVSRFGFTSERGPTNDTIALCLNLKSYSPSP